MATGVASWSKTAASNATADSNVNWAEGQAPSTVNNSARAEMASVAMWRDDISGTLTTGGTSTAYTLTTNQSFASAAAMDGAMIAFKPHATNGADPTLAVDGLTARQIVTTSGTNVGAAQLVAGRVYVVTYVNASTEFRLHNAYPLTISGLTAETAVAVADVFPFYDDSAADNRKVTVPNLFKAVSVLDAETSPATDDLLLMTDTSDSNAANRITLANLLKVVNSLTEDASPDGANDFLLTYDASASAAKKVKPSSLAAVQSDQETGSSTALFVTPGRQHFHPGHPKCWAVVTVSGGTPTLATNYNITSVTDDAVGELTITIATDFSSANWACVAMIEGDDDEITAAVNGSKAAGAVQLNCRDASAAADNDPTSWSMIGCGDQA